MIILKKTKSIETNGSALISAMAALMAHELKHLIMLCIAFAFQDNMQLVHLYFPLVVTFSSITQLQCIIWIEYCLLVHQICNLVPPLFADRG